MPRSNYQRVEIDSLLAEVLVEGPASLLRVALSSAVHFVVQAPGQAVLELSERRYLRQGENGAWSITDGNNYLNQLLLYFSGCPEATAAAQVAPFTAEGLAAVVQAYNTTCTTSQQPGRSWVQRATPRRRLSFQGGVLAGARYNRIENSRGYTDGSCVDCQVHPFGGLYAEVFQPSRTAAVYGEFSFSRFQGQDFNYDYSATGQQLTFAQDYRAWLATARLGFRYFFPLPHETQFLLGFGYEYNVLLNPRFVSNGASVYVGPYQELVYAAPTILPHLALGWRTGRTTFSTDGQLYHSSDYDNFLGSLLGSNYAVRLSLSYRLGHNPDAPSQAVTR